MSVEIGGEYIQLATNISKCMLTKNSMTNIYVFFSSLVRTKNNNGDKFYCHFRGRASGEKVSRQISKRGIIYIISVDAAI